jgi:hypothetical protein
MTAAAATSADFTGSSDFDSFAQTLVGLLFWHLIDSLNIKVTVYSIWICWSIPQPGNSRKNEKSLYSPHRAQSGFSIKYRVFLLTLFML